MTRLGDVYGSRSRDRRGGGGSFTVGRIKATPDGPENPVHVIVDQFDRRFEFGPFPWRPYGTAEDPVTPQQGDDALLAHAGSARFLVDWYPA